MFDSTEEMCVWGDSSEVQVVGHQEAGEVGRGRVQGGDGGGGGPQQGHLEEVCTAGADAGGPAKEKWEISPGDHWECGLQHSGQEREISVQGTV